MGPARKIMFLSAKPGDDMTGGANPRFTWLWAMPGSDLAWGPSPEVTWRKGQGRKWLCLEGAKP